MANIIDTVIEKGNFKILLSAIQGAELTDILSSAGPFTIFAPSDKAFEKLPAAAITELLQDKTKLIAFVTYHLVTGQHMSSDVVRQDSLKTAQGQKVKVTHGSSVVINNARVVNADICTDNGVIHEIDSLIMPNWLRSPARSNSS